MPRKLAPGVRDRKATLELLEALGSSLDIRTVLERAYPPLLELVPADYGALGISSSGRPEDYEWMVAKIPPAFFGAYPEMAPHDFVRQSVSRQINVVLRDEDMVPRSDIEANMMYRRAREIGAPLEQVMAVMLHVDRRWQSGLSLYREKRRPFSLRERAALQRMTPAIANAVRNCHVFGEASDWGAALKRLLDDREAAMILVAPPATDVARTPRASELMEKWFAPHEQRAGSLPAPLVALIAGATNHPFSSEIPRRCIKQGPEKTLQASFALFAGSAGRATGMLLLEEFSRALPIPSAWCSLLTPKQREVTLRVLRGWDNRLIATELGCLEATVKKHMQNIFDKIGVQSRTALVARAAEMAVAESL